MTSDHDNLHRRHTPYNPCNPCSAYNQCARPGLLRHFVSWCSLARRGLLVALTGLLACCLAPAAWAEGLASLEAFIRTTHGGHADFTQVVTAPTKAGQAARVRHSSGTFDFVRPNHFRFVYAPPLAQTIVADGRTLWLFDADLNQVTARKQTSMLASTPAALLASAPDIKTLQLAFILTAAPDQDGMEWVVATPKATDSSLQSIRVGFRSQTLAVLDVVDSFGQRSVMTFGNLQTSRLPEASLFQFKPPAGVDVIWQ